MGLWNAMVGFKKVVNKNYILISPNRSSLLPKSIFSIFFKKIKKIKFIHFGGT